MVLGPGQVVEGQVSFPDVLVGSPVLRVDGERLLVDGNGGGGITVLPGRVGQPVVGVGVLAVTSHHALQETDGRGEVTGLDRLHRGRLVRIPGSPGATTRPRL